MTKTIEFFKQDNLWFADVPNRTLEENEMVDGADTLLEFLANDHSRVALTISTELDIESIIHLKMIEYPSVFQHLPMTLHPKTNPYKVSTSPLEQQHNHILHP